MAPSRFSERLALFASAMTAADLPELLAGLPDAERDAAGTFLSQLSALDSGARQARLTLEFGWRTDALARLQALVVEAPPRLRVALGAVMPAPYAAHFPHLRHGPPTSAALQGLALRLVRAAVRI